MGKALLLLQQNVGLGNETETTGAASTRTHGEDVGGSGHLGEGSTVPTPQLGTSPSLPKPQRQRL